MRARVYRYLRDTWTPPNLRFAIDPSPDLSTISLRLRQCTCSQPALDTQQHHLPSRTKSIGEWQKSQLPQKLWDATKRKTQNEPELGVIKRSVKQRHHSTENWHQQYIKKEEIKKRYTLISRQDATLLCNQAGLKQTKISCRMLSTIHLPKLSHTSLSSKRKRWVD